MASTVSGQNAFINCMKMEEYKGSQTISFGSLASKTVGDAAFGLTATASSGLSVTYTSSNTGVATVSGSTVTIIAAGSTTITASQAGDGTYDAATSVNQTLIVSAGALSPQTITFGSLSAKSIGDANFDLTATASSGLAVSYSSSNTAVATISGSTVSIVGAGSTDITASQVGNGSYAAAPNVIQTLTVNKLNQTITFGSLSAKTDTDAPFTVTTPTSTSGLTVTLTSSNTNVALISGTTITIVGAGTSTITASQAGNATYNAATSVPQTLTVSSTLSVNQNLFFDFGPNETTNGDVTVNPDANGNYWNNITPAAGSAAISAGTTGGTLVNSSNSTTSYGLAFTSAGFTPNGKVNGGLLSPYASQFGSNSELAIATATEDYIYTGATSNGPVITFSGLNTSKRYRFKIFGCRNSASDRAGQYTLQGAGAASVGTIQSSTTVGLGGTVYIDAATSYPANLNVSYTLTSQGSNTQAVTYYGNNSSVYYSGLIQPDVTGNITLTTITTTPSAAFAYINNMKIEEYATAQTITFGALSAKSYGDTDYSAGATASSGLTVSLSSSNTAVATIVSDQIHIVGPGSTTITASQVGNSTYSPATSVSQSLTVNKASSSITATGTTSFAYNHSAQGPASATESGSTGAITYSYSGTGGTTYAASATKPTNVGTYQVIATVAADANYNTASSTPLAFSITAVSTIAPVSIISNPLGTYPLDQSVTWTFDLTGSEFTAGEDLYLWIWSPSEPDFGNWTNSSSFAKLTYVSGMVWSMTLTPTTYFSKTVSEIQASAGFWMLLKDKKGNLKTADFSVSQTINRQVVNITASKTSTDLTNIFADVTVSTGGSLTLDASRTIHDITIERGGKVTNNNGVTLTANNFTINSDASGTGTYIDNGTTTISGTTNVNQYITSGRNWYVSSPISNATSAVFSASESHPLYWYDEAHGSTVQWAQITNTSTSLPPMQGFIANMASSGVVTFSGSLNNGDKSITVYRTAGQTKEGFNLLGNPYPSYLDWVNATKSNLLSTLWYRTKTTPAPVTGATNYVFDTYNATGGIGTSNGAKAVTNLIPPMQAFWVRVNEGQTSGSLSVTNSQRAHADNGNNTMKVKSGISSTQPVLRLEVSNGTTSDQAVVYFNAGASNNYDDYDSPKMSNTTASIPEIYTLAGSEQVVINGVNDMTELALGFTTGVANNFTIKASQFTDFVTGTEIVLRDNLLNYEQDLTLSDYSFYSDVTANNETRFTILFKAPSVATGINPNPNSNVWISLANNQIVVNGASTESTVAVYNAVGQRLISQHLTATTKALGAFVPGVYMVTVTNAGNKITKKVIID
ncbi:MAG: T9SS type A sorting domain-containing protein [Paludibacter sp.]